MITVAALDHSTGSSIPSIRLFRLTLALAKDPLKMAINRPAINSTIPVTMVAVTSLVSL
jgi:hypothetical protein